MSDQRFQHSLLFHQRPDMKDMFGNVWLIFYDLRWWGPLDFVIGVFWKTPVGGLNDGGMIRSPKKVMSIGERRFCMSRLFGLLTVVCLQLFVCLLIFFGCVLEFVVSVFVCFYLLVFRVFNSGRSRLPVWTFWFSGLSRSLLEGVSPACFNLTQRDEKGKGSFDGPANSKTNVGMLISQC